MYRGFDDVKDIIYSMTEKMNDFKNYFSSKSNKKKDPPLNTNNDSILFASLTLIFRYLCIFLKEIYYSFLTNTKKCYKLIEYKVNSSKRNSTDLIPGDIIKICDDKIRNYYDSQNLENVWMIIDIEFHHNEIVFIVENMQDSNISTGLLPEFCEFLHC